METRGRSRGHDRSFKDAVYPHSHGWVLYPEPNIILRLLFATVNNHTRVLFARVLSILAVHLKVKCGIHTPRPDDAWNHYSSMLP
jgi:hypothetical protein